MINVVESECHVAHSYYSSSAARVGEEMADKTAYSGQKWDLVSTVCNQSLDLSFEWGNRLRENSTRSSDVFSSALITFHMAHNENTINSGVICAIINTLYWGVNPGHTSPFWEFWRIYLQRAAVGNTDWIWRKPWGNFNMFITLDQFYNYLLCLGMLSGLNLVSVVLWIFGAGRANKQIHLKQFTK